MESDDSTALVTALRRAADSLVTRRSLNDLESTLAQIVLAAVETVPGADAGGISITEGDHVGSRVPSNDDIRQLDRRQGDLHQGPCVTAVTDPPPSGVVYAADLSVPPDRERWPEFAPEAVALGYHCLLSTQLSSERGVRTALNLYARAAGAFDDSGRTLAGLFGSQAAILLYGAGHAANLEQALATRDLIGRAKGVLIERFGVDDDRAFQMLVRSSQDTNMKLVEVARWLTGPEGRG